MIGFLMVRVHETRLVVLKGGAVVVEVVMGGQIGHIGSQDHLVYGVEICHGPSLAIWLMDAWLCHNGA